MDLDLRLLRYFVAVAEELHFGRAAARLRVSQPALSHQIRKLENDLGVGLFERTSRRVELTEAGEALLEEGRKTLESAGDALARVRRYADADAGVLRVGFIAGGAGGLTTAALKEFERRNPGVRLEVRRFEWAEQSEGIKEGRADVGFVRLPVEDPDLALEPVMKERRVAGLCRQSSPLADRDSVSVLELNGEPVITTTSAPEAWVRWHLEDPRPDGSRPLYGPAVDTVEEMLEVVATGGGHCITAESVAKFYPRPDISYVPICDVEPSGVALAWPRRSRSSLVRDFVEATRSAAEKIATNREKVR